jgi:hypothetical protein
VSDGAPAKGNNPDNVLPGVVRGVVFTGDHIACRCETDDGTVAAKLAPDDNTINHGDDIQVVISAKNCIAS